MLAISVRPEKDAKEPSLDHEEMGPGRRWSARALVMEDAADLGAIAACASLMFETTRCNPCAELGAAAVTFDPKMTGQGEPGGVT
ncbi:hypothetical protein HFO55_26090 [Rhizobium leguminosarum]|nr:hypothetical protein [Rhizobium leguminosarum]MBY5577242.1 hypothetical protein [Rhizobium leguminosarum]